MSLSDQISELNLNFSFTFQTQQNLTITTPITPGNSLENQTINSGVRLVRQAPNYEKQVLTKNETEIKANLSIQKVSDLVVANTQSAAKRNKQLFSHSRRETPSHGHYQEKDCHVKEHFYSAGPSHSYYYEDYSSPLRSSRSDKILDEDELVLLKAFQIMRFR
jgi:hypothetical protein